MRDLVAGVRQRVSRSAASTSTAGPLPPTNDGDLAMRLTRPRYGVLKTYEVK